MAIEPEGQDAATRGQCAPEIGVDGIAGKHEDPVGRQAAGNLALGAGDAVDTAEALQMGAAGIGDQSDIRAGDVGHIADLAVVIGTYLKHQEIFVASTHKG